MAVEDQTGGAPAELVVPVSRAWSILLILAVPSVMLAVVAVAGLGLIPGEKPQLPLGVTTALLAGLGLFRVVAMAITNLRYTAVVFGPRAVRFPPIGLRQLGSKTFRHDAIEALEQVRSSGGSNHLRVHAAGSHHRLDKDACGAHYDEILRELERLSGVEVQHR